MRIIVLGGYGVFGAKLVELLTRDKHEVIVAGRSAEKAEALAAQYGAGHVAVDRTGDLMALWALNPDLIVDAAGPFHAYGDDPYAFAKACVGQGVNYLDLCDDPSFCAGITTLDRQARAAGVFALSGASSVPAISSAVVAALSQDTDEIDTISTAILPGNRAPRGRSVVSSILNQCGETFDVVTDGTSTPIRSWSRPEMFDLGQGIRRRGWVIEVPDHRLFADAFGARSVQFRAGLELGIMNWSLAVLSWLRGKWPFRVPNALVGIALKVSKMLYPFGTDVGGMSVAVSVRSGRDWQLRNWRLVAKEGDGPFIPAVAARTIARDMAQIEPGARPAIAEVPLDALEAAMADLAVTTEIVTHEQIPIFPQHLGSQFDQLAPQVRALHSTYGIRRWAGRAKVKRGTSMFARLLAKILGFPPAHDDMPVSVTITPENGQERWERDFAGDQFVSHLRVQNGHMTERFGPLTFDIGLHVDHGQLVFPVTRGRCGPIPLPKFALPRSVAREFEDSGKFHFDVALYAPFTGALIVHYQGWLTREKP
ncbi:SDR family oxidoreductase [Loktanella sp. S4079]|uniref:SDR family oxidoreductase n=1 Tax=Loktanella sp. S4079 TaxID=579483 RepID=UPI0005FA502B|nr:SDR family oxidoreductase [Loktanella sp. S4079]KJZ19753.1 hypothetical protein TW80_02320 [Loktanella sp. S4079]